MNNYKPVLNAEIDEEVFKKLVAEEGFYSPHTRRDQMSSRHIIMHDLLLLPKKKKK